VAVLMLQFALASPASGEVRDIELTIRDGQLPKAQQLVRVRQGDEVTLRWTTDRPLAAHLHGYDIEAKLAPGAPVLMRFTARATGRFPVAIHGARGEEKTVLYLEVHPR
jgi:FtsP/CotA-like multicopper oxidase with cupredoxin domain